MEKKFAEQKWLFYKIFIELKPKIVISPKISIINAHIHNPIRLQKLKVLRLIAVYSYDSVKF